MKHSETVLFNLWCCFGKKRVNYLPDRSPEYNLEFPCYVVRYREGIRFNMPGTFTNRHHDIMVGDTQRFMIQRLRQEIRFTFRASHEDMFAAPEPDEIPVASQTQVGRFPEMIADFCFFLKRKRARFTVWSTIHCRTWLVHSFHPQNLTIRKDTRECPAIGMPRHSKIHVKLAL
jgi:hypothetical protein